jgi:hypothetical protein
MKKQQTTTKSKSLVELRQEGLKEIQSRGSMQALGKYRGWDAFAWGSPKFDALTTVLSSLPFNVAWIGTHEQIRCAAKYYPEIIDQLETVIVYDRASIKFTDEALLGIDNIIGVGDLESTWKIVDSLSEDKRALFFTSEGDQSLTNIENFKEFIGK